MTNDIDKMTKEELENLIKTIKTTLPTIKSTLVRKTLITRMNKAIDRLKNNGNE